MANLRYRYFTEYSITEANLIGEETLNKCSFSNGLALDLLAFAHDKKVNHDKLINWISSLSGNDISTISKSALVNHLHRVKKKAKVREVSKDRNI